MWMKIFSTLPLKAHTAQDELRLPFTLIKNYKLVIKWVVGSFLQIHLHTHVYLKIKLIRLRGLTTHKIISIKIIKILLRYCLRLRKLITKIIDNEMKCHVLIMINSISACCTQIYALENSLTAAVSLFVSIFGLKQNKVYNT